MKRVTIEQAAAHLGTTNYTIRRGIRLGRWPAITLGGKYLLDLEELEKCLRNEAEQNRQKAREQWQSYKNNWM